MQTLEISELDVTDDLALRAAYDVDRRAALVGREDSPYWSFQEMEGAIRRPDPGEKQVRVIARVAGRIVGVGGVYLGLTDNLDKCWLDVSVDPEEQHRGYGKALLDHICAIAVEHERTSLITEATLPFDRVSDHRYRRFAEAAGFTLSNVEIVRHLPLPVPETDLGRWADEAEQRCADYRVETHVNVVPDNLVPDLVVLLGQLGVDAPSGDVEWEEEQITPERFQETRASLVAAGRTIYETVAIAPDGTVAAQSTISVPPPGRLDAAQWGTFVHRQHRGRRLGLAVKAANLRAVQEAHPELRRVFTQNAETNEWMIAINEQIGFAPVEACASFVRRI